MDNVEMWRSVPYEGYSDLYEVSDKGRVKMLAHRRGNRSYSTRLLKGSSSASTRWHNIIRMTTREGVQKAVLRSRLVLETFVGPAPEDKPFACHIDDDPTNNSLENLRWGSKSDNEQDKVRNGRNYNTNKTRCKNGHEFTPENTYHRKNGGRTCRACMRNWSKAFNERQDRKSSVLC